MSEGAAGSQGIVGTEGATATAAAPSRMARLRRVPWGPAAVFLAVAVVVFVAERWGGTIAGSRIDWISQHAAFLGSFRERFWATHELLPQLALGSGAGQSIYYLAYYGLFNPLYQLSFAFPMVSSEAWLEGCGLVSHWACGLLCYLWLRKGCGERGAVCGGLMLMLSCSVAYQSYAQVMFVNYLPWLLVVLIGADRREAGGSAALVVVGTFFLILTSFYFAPAALVAVGVHMLAGTIEDVRGLGRRIADLVRRVVPIICGILLAAFYLLPICFAILGGRSGSSATFSWDLLWPGAKVSDVLYGTYGLGLAAMAVLVVFVWLACESGRERTVALLVIVVVGVPAFSWLFNGGLYVRAKALLPFLPLVAWLFGRFVERDGRGGFTAAQLGLGAGVGALALLAMLAFGSARYRLPLLADLALCVVAFAVSRRRWRAILPAVGICAMAVACLAAVLGTSSTRVTLERLAQVQDPALEAAVSAAATEADGTYRTEVRGDSEFENMEPNRTSSASQLLTTAYSSLGNGRYRDFRDGLCLAKTSRNRFFEGQEDDPLFLRLMGVRYLVSYGSSGWTAPAGWSERSDLSSGDATVYENDQVMPLCYLTSQTMPESSYEGLSWEQRQLALLEYAFVPGTGSDAASGSGSSAATDASSEALPQVQAIGASFAAASASTGLVANSSNMVAVTASAPIRTTLALERPTTAGEVVFVSFSVTNKRSSSDVTVTIGGQRNRLSASTATYYNGNTVFHCVLVVPAGTSSLEVTFGEGNYRIKDLSCTVGSVDESLSSSLGANAASLGATSSGDGLSGTVTAEGEQWLVTTIPYDEGFTVYVDGKQVEARCVNQAFLGALIPDGTHEVEIRFVAKGSREGLAVSGTTAALLAAVWAVRRARRRKAGGQGAPAGGSEMGQAL